MKSVSIILAGAASRGAYEAGVLQAVAERGIQVRRVVGALSARVQAHSTA